MEDGLVRHSNQKLTLVLFSCLCVCSCPIHGCSVRVSPIWESPISEWLVKKLRQQERERKATIKRALMKEETDDERNHTASDGSVRSNTGLNPIELPTPPLTAANTIDPCFSPFSPFSPAVPISYCDVHDDLPATHWCCCGEQFCHVCEHDPLRMEQHASHGSTLEIKKLISQLKEKRRERLNLLQPLHNKMQAQLEQLLRDEESE